jgi:hypothetical protein
VAQHATVPEIYARAVNSSFGTFVETPGLTAEHGARDCGETQRRDGARCKQ